MRIRELLETNIQANRQGNTIWIDYFEVPVRGKGLGSREYKDWESNLPQDITKIRLHASDAGHGPSHGFWDQMGFDYEFPDDDNQMIKHLPADESLYENSELDERKMADLYHSTDAEFLPKILAAGQLTPGRNEYISLTRNKRYNFGAVASHEAVQFVIDQAKLAYNRKIEPYDWHMDPDDNDVEAWTRDPAERRSESEERVKGPISLKYVKEIQLPKRWADTTTVSNKHSSLRPKDKINIINTIKNMGIKISFTTPGREMDEVAKVKISTDPNDFGAYVRDGGKDEPTVMLPIKKINQVLEPDDLHQTKPGAPERIKNMVIAIRQGKSLPPILVRRHKLGYQVLDGHHRFKAYKIAKATKIPARIVDPKNITVSEIKVPVGALTDFTLNEVADQPYKTFSKGESMGAFKAKFIAKGSLIQVNITPYTRDKKIVDVGFFDATDDKNPTIDMTGKGDAFRIFATVGAIVKDYIAKNNPDVLTFSGKTRDPSRIRLYDLIAKNIGKYLPGYKLGDSGVDLGDKRYTFVREPKGIDETREGAFNWLKSYLPNWPEYVLRDWLYRGLTAKEHNPPENPKEVIDRILASEGMSAQTQWKLIPNFEFNVEKLHPDTQRRIQIRAGGSANPMNVPKDAERHATQAALAQQQGGVRKEPVIGKMTPQGFELIEGWHRTIQHFKQFPNGYRGPAWVANGTGVTG